MPVMRLNHAVLYVRDVRASVDFYTSVLGFRLVSDMAGLHGAAFLQASGSSNDHDLGLFEIGSAAAASGAGRTLSGSTTSPGRSTRSRSCRPPRSDSPRQARSSARPTTRRPRRCTPSTPTAWSSRCRWLVPADLSTTRSRPAARIKPLDLDREIARYGATTRGGVGVSHLVPTA